MERPGSADPNGEKVAERTWDCPCHAWHLGSLRRSIVSGEPKCRPSPSVPYANGAWRARDLPETALHATSPRLTPRPSTAGSPPRKAVDHRSEGLHVAIGHDQVGDPVAVPAHLQRFGDPISRANGNRWHLQDEFARGRPPALLDRQALGRL